MSDHGLSPDAEAAPADDMADAGDALRTYQGGRAIRAVVSAIAIFAFGVWVAVGRVHTHLGVKAVSWDKDGREQIWRVWWRARDDIIESSSSAFVVLYVGLTLAVAVLSALALWIALVPEDPSPPQIPDR